MSLSDLCSQQHKHEQARLRKILLWGVLGSMGLHGIALTLSNLDLVTALAKDELTPIELIVTESFSEKRLDEPLEEAINEPLDEPDFIERADLSTETNVPAATAPRAAVAALPPPPASEAVPDPVAELPEPEPLESAESLETSEDIADDEISEAESDLEVAEDEAEADETEEPQSETSENPETDMAAIDPNNAPQFNRLRDYFQQLRDAQAESSAAGRSEVGEQPSSDAQTAARSSPGDSNSGSSDSDSGGSGDSNSGSSGLDDGGLGSRTIACRNCARPDYPESALAAGVEGQPIVSVDINPDGSVRSVTLTRSSGNPEIDQAAMQAARRSQFEPVAGGASVPVEYDLTIEGSRRNRDARRRGERRAVEAPPESAPAATPVADSPDTSPNTAISPTSESPANEADKPSDTSSPAISPPAISPEPPPPAPEPPPPAPEPPPPAPEPPPPAPEPPPPAPEPPPPAPEPPPPAPEPPPPAPEPPPPALEPPPAPEPPPPEG